MIVWTVTSTIACVPVSGLIFILFLYATKCTAFPGMDQQKDRRVTPVRTVPVIVVSIGQVTATMQPVIKK